MAFSRLFQSCRKCFLSEAEILKEKNHANPKVRGQLISSESQEIFAKARQMLQDVPFNSEEADVIIAGASIWAMTCEDRKYYDWRHTNTPDTPAIWWLRETRCYPNKTLLEISRICNVELGGKLSADDIRNNITIIGRRALNEKDLGFEGIISAFSVNEFYDSDWSEWTDRFDKYALTELAQAEQDVKLKRL